MNETNPVTCYGCLMLSNGWLKKAIEAEKRGMVAASAKFFEHAEERDRLAHKTIPVACYHERKLDKNYWDN